MISLQDCEEAVRDDGGARYTHASGAYVEIIHDDDPCHPLDNDCGMAISYREGSRYRGTMDDYPDEPRIECPACAGTGDSPDRFELRRYGRLLAVGAEHAVYAAGELFGMPTWMANPVECPQCAGCADVPCDLATWFRVEHGATGIYEFSPHNDASAVMVATDSDWTGPAGAAKAWADEYQKWAEGDCWGIVTGGPGIEGESVWGFIGSEHAEEEAASMLDGAVFAVEREATEAAYWGARGVLTI